MIVVELMISIVVEKVVDIPALISKLAIAGEDTITVTLTRWGVVGWKWQYFGSWELQLEVVDFRRTVVVF